MGIKHLSKISCDRKQINNNKLLFIASIMGFGLFTYFLGRSHSNTFVMCIWPVFIILVFFLQELIAWLASGLQFTQLKKRFLAKASDIAMHIFLWLLMAATLASVFLPVFSYYTLNSQENWQTYSQVRENPVGVESDPIYEIIKKYMDTEDVAIIHAFSSFYASSLKINNAYKGPALVDWLLSEDLSNMLDFLEEYDGRLFIAASLVENPQLHMAASAAIYGPKLANLLLEKYRPVYIVGDIDMYVYDKIPL